MPDIQEFVVARGGTVSLNNVPTWSIEFKVTDSKTGRTLRDFTGAKAFSFPQVFATFSPEDQDDLVAKWVTDMIHKKAPDLF